MPTLRETFEQVRQQQTRLYFGRNPTRFDRKVDALIWRATELAMDDSAADRAKLRVASAPTGSGKTSVSVVIAVAGLMADPSFTAGFVLQFAKSVEDVYQDILRLLPEELHDEVAVWTTAHDEKTPDAVSELDFNFVPKRRFNKDALKKARVVLGTHHKLLEDLSRSRTSSLTAFQGRPRSVVWVDETPDLVALLPTTPGDVEKLRDLVLQRDEHDPLVATLTRIHERMNEAFRQGTKAGSFLGVRLIEDEDDLSRLTEGFCHGLLKDTLNSGNEALAAQVKLARLFLHAAAKGFVFFSAYEPVTFVAYELSFRLFPGLVLLDATADLNGIRLLLPDLERLETPRVDYRNLRLHHVPTPGEFQINTRTLLSGIRRAKPYAEWIKATVVENSSPGELVLLVAHKALFNWGLLERASDPTKPWLLEGRRVVTLYWGHGIGSNFAKDAQAVFLMGEFHVPRPKIAATVLALRQQAFTKAADITDTKGSALRGDFLRYQDDHYCRWQVQLGARGSIRLIDGDGVASTMRLYSTAPVERLLRIRQEYWQGCPLPVMLGGKDKEAGTKAEALVALLLEQDIGSVLWFTDVAEKIDIPVRVISRLLDRPKVRDVIDAYGWSVVTRKELGLSGKGQGLRRNPSRQPTAA
jgi:hypothetical protein